jgi:SAM-dependent methyltransferase
MTAPWYESLFDERYLVLYEEAFHAGASAAEIDFIERAIALDPGSRVLDLGCGYGRHAIPLALRGYQVTGLDLSAVQIDAARRLAAELGAEVQWLRRDLRDLSGLGPFDACLCLYTVFGYFTDEDNARALAQVHAVLRPGGVLLLDVDNPLGLLPRLPEQRWHETARGVRREVHEYEPMTGRLVSRRSLIQGAGLRLDLPESSVRLYLPHELAALLRSTGFEVEQLHGGVSGAPYHWKLSTMQSFVARRI